MTKLVINNIDVTELLEKKFQKLGQGWLTLLQIPAEVSLNVNVEAIKSLQKLGYEGVYVSLSKDYMELSKILREKGVDVDRLLFIDGISQLYGIARIDSPNVVYVDGPLSIDKIAENVNTFVLKMKSDKKFVFLDSITTILLYNSLERTLQFSNFLMESLKKLQVVGVVVSISKGFANDSLVAEIAKVSNEVIELEENK